MWNQFCECNNLHFYVTFPIILAEIPDIAIIPAKSRAPEKSGLPKVLGFSVCNYHNAKSVFAGSLV